MEAPKSEPMRPRGFERVKGHSKPRKLQSRKASIKHFVAKRKAKRANKV